MIPPGSTAIVGAAESTEIGKVPNMSSVGLAIDAAANAMKDAGVTASDIDGFTCGYFPVADMSRQLGIFPSWADNTVVGGCSWFFQLRNAIAAIHAGYCETVLIVYGESGRSTRGSAGARRAPRGEGRATSARGGARWSRPPPSARHARRKAPAAASSIDQEMIAAPSACA